MHASYSAIFLAVVLVATRAAAHTTGVSQSELTVGADGTVDAELVFAVAEIAVAVTLDANHDGVVTDDELDAARPDLKKLLLDGVEVKADGRACPASFRGAELAEADGLLLSASYACPPSARSIEVTLFLLSALRPGHRHVARVSDGARSLQKLLSGTSRSVVMELDPSRAPRPQPTSGWRRDAVVALTASWTIGMLAFLVVRWRRGRRAKKP